MSEANQAQAETSPAAASDTFRRQFYSPWMIGVLVVFVVCECLLFAWGDNAVPYAWLGLFFASIFNVARCWRVIKADTETSCLEIFVVLLIIAILIAMLLPAMQAARESARRMQCSNHLKQLGLALLNYEYQFNHFPPVFVADEAGRPMHSWRTLLLPFVERDDLYDAYDFDQLWDAPDNQSLITDSEFAADWLQCPSIDDSGRLEHRTDYVAVTGNDTIWPTDGTSRTSKDITAGTSNAAMLIEINNSDIQWNEPRDVKLEDLLSGKVSWSETAPHTIRNAFYLPVPGRNMVFADGSVRFVSGNLTPDQIRRLFSITEPFDVEAEASQTDSRPIVFRHIVFYVWLATLLLQFAYVFFPLEKRGQACECG